MKRSMAFGAMLAAIATLALAACASGGIKGPPPDVDLSGTWLLNYEESDDARNVMAEAGRGQRGGRPGGRGRGGRPGAGPGGRRPGGDPAQTRQLMQSVMRPAARMVIAQGDTTVTLTLGDGQELVIPTNGRKFERDFGQGLKVEVKAEWKGAALRMERNIAGRAKITETYSRNPGSTRLIVVTKLEGPLPRALRFRRVYDAAPSR